MKDGVKLAALALSALLAAAPMSAAAQAGPTPPEVLTGDTPGLPANLRAKGHQGEVALTGIVKASGELSDVQVRISSGSAELDAFAMQAFQRWRFKPARDAQGVAVDRRVSTTLEFWADGLMTFGEKTCAEFVADTDWHRATFPDKSDKNMRLYRLMGGMLLIGAPSKVFPTEAAARRAHETLPDAWLRTYAACRSRPGDRFFAVLLRELKR